MIVSCPACSTRYLLEPSALGPDGRSVRCAKCQHSWHQQPPDDMPHEVDLTVPLAGSVPLPNRPRPGGGGSRGAGLPLLILVLLGLGLAGGYFFRERIMAEWPKTVQIYELIGLPSKAVGVGLEINNTKYSKQEVSGQRVLEIQCEIFNKTDKDIVIPPLKLELQNDAGLPLLDWTANVDPATIHAGETINFQTEAKDPPAGATKLVITFAGGN